MIFSNPRSPESSGTALPAKDSRIGREMAKGAGWMVLARVFVQGIGFLSTIILARLLVPADFGLVALATAFSGVLLAMSEFNFGLVLIQNQNAEPRHYDTAWTLGVLRNTIVALILVGFAGLIADFWGDPRVEAIVYVLAATTLISGFQNIGIVDFVKYFAFRKDFTLMVLAKIGMFVIAIPLAFTLRSYWALVGGIAAGIFVQVILSYIMHSYRPRFSLFYWREIMHFSKWLLLNNIVSFVYQRGDTFVIGKIAGAPTLGIYSVAFEIANLTTQSLISPLRRAIFPGYATMSADLERLQKSFVDVMGLIFLIGTPTSLGVGLVAEPLVRVFLGEQWLDAIPLIQVLALYGFLSVISAGSGPVYLALARPQYLAWILSGSILVMIPLLIWSVDRSGAIGAAWAVTVTTAMAVVFDIFLVRRLLHLQFRRLLVATWRPLVSVMLMIASVIILQQDWPTPDSLATWSAMLVGSVAIGTVVYITSILILWTVSGRMEGAEKHIFVAIRARGRI